MEYGIYLGNLALALRSANRLADAVEVMDRSLEVTAQSVGTEHEEYAGSLNIKGRVNRGDYGWTEIRFDRAEALRLLERLDEAEAILRDLVEFSERA